MEKEKILIFVRNIALLFSLVFLVLGFSNLSYSQKSVSIEKNEKNNVNLDTKSATSSNKVSKELGTTSPKKLNKAEKCEVNNFDFDCYYNYYNYLVKEKGLKETFSVLKEEYKTNPYVFSQCHQITHVIGHAAYTMYPNVSEAFKRGDAFCWSGYYHGVMEEVLERIGLKGIEKELNNVCQGIEGKAAYSFDYYNCVHGLGHGVMAVNNDELFLSLKMCDLLNGAWEKESCYGGVYMENVIIDSKGEKSKYLKPEDPLYPCNAVDFKYKTSCYMMQTSYALKVNGNDFSKVFEFCRNSDKGYESICFQSLGRDASGQSGSNAEATKRTCELGKDLNEVSNCVIGASKDFVSYFHSDKEAKYFCSILSKEVGGLCLDTVQNYYQSF